MTQILLIWGNQSGINLLNQWPRLIIRNQAINHVLIVLLISVCENHQRPIKQKAQRLSFPQKSCISEPECGTQKRDNVSTVFYTATRRPCWGKSCPITVHYTISALPKALLVE